MGCGLAGERNLPLVKTHNLIATGDTLRPSSLRRTNLRRLRLPR